MTVLPLQSLSLFQLNWTDESCGRSIQPFLDISKNLQLMHIMILYRERGLGLGGDFPISKKSPFCCCSPPPHFTKDRFPQFLGKYWVYVYYWSHPKLVVTLSCISEKSKTFTSFLFSIFVHYIYICWLYIRIFANTPTLELYAQLNVMKEFSKWVKKSELIKCNETLFYCWRIHIGNYSRVVMVITSENNKLITSGRRPRVINSLFHEWLPSPQVNNSNMYESTIE